LLISQPQASADEMLAYYGHTFYERQWPDSEAVWAENSREYERYELPLMERLWSPWQPARDGKAVEIGCGYGVMLEALCRRGFRVRGCEISNKAVECCRARGLDVLQGSFPGVDLGRQSYDLAVAVHVIEHVADPRSFVREVIRLVRPGGVVAFITEDAWISQYAWQRLQARMTGGLPPFRSSRDHTFVFAASHLKRLMLSEGCEEVASASYHRVPQRESLHWKLYKQIFRIIDRLAGHGEFLMAVGRVSGA
jgi:2-polyprenyl-3-methyl-5-hydroxy-6-metoxy-1,4-benzoquinol methylase